MRTIRVEERESGTPWVWLAAGALLGLGIGALVTRRTRGGRTSLRALVTRGKDLASMLAENIGPLVETARGLKDAWDGEELDDELEDERDDELDEELGEESEDDIDDEDDEDDEDDDEDDEVAAHHDALVLEVFSHDPILAERPIEIEEVRTGDILLHGNVRHAREVKHALTLARGVPGVTRVREKLAIVRRR